MQAFTRICLHTKTLCMSLFGPCSWFAILKRYELGDRRFVILPWVAAAAFFHELGVGMRLNGLFGFALCAFATWHATANAQVFWVGGYGPGIYASRLQPNGAMDAPQLVAEQPNPSFFAIHPTLNVIYCVAETARSDSKQRAALAAYQFDNASYARGEFSPLKRISLESVNGDGPCHVTLDREGKWAVVSNYSSGSVSLFPIDTSGALQAESHSVSHQGTGPIVSRQQGAHAHCAMFDPSNRYVMVADLGIDRVCLLYTSPSPRDLSTSRMPSSA